MKIYLVQETRDYDTYAIFWDKDDAIEFLEDLKKDEDNKHLNFEIDERTLFYGPPPVKGYNK